MSSRHIPAARHTRRSRLAPLGYLMASFGVLLLISSFQPPVPPISRADASAQLYRQPVLRERPWLFGFCLFDTRLSTRLVSDEEARRMFTEHREQFCRLRDLMLAEPVIERVDLEGRVAIYDKYASLQTRSGEAAELSEELYKRYLDLQDLLATTGAKEVRRFYSSRDVEFYIYSYGSVVTGESKSILFSRGSVSVSPGPPVVTTDEKAGQAHDGTWYNVLEDSWYIKLDRS